MDLIDAPEKLTGGEFEKRLSLAAEIESRRGVLTMDHYGVTLSVQNGVTMGISSKPDFEGVIANGRQFVFEAKVCSSASFPLTKDKIKPRQISHMLTRSRFNVPCFLVVHWNARVLKRSKINAVTVALPVSDVDPRWTSFIDAHIAAKLEKTKVIPQGSISLEESLSIGKIVPWILPKGCRKPRPDIVSFIWPQAPGRTSWNCQPTLL